MEQGKIVYTIRRNLRSASLNVRSTTLNVRSKALNIRSTTLNGDFPYWKKEMPLEVTAFSSRDIPFYSSV